MRTTMRRYVPFLALAALFVALLLFTRTRLGLRVAGWVARGEPRRMQDPIYALLRREVQQLGKELEALPYERLREFDDRLAYTYKVVDGVDIYFNSELVSVAKNGDLHVCIDAGTRAPGWQWRGALPSYNFMKRQDGSVYW
jgi:hypothetical protein